MNEAKSVSKWAASVAMAREFDSNPPIISPRIKDLVGKLELKFLSASSVWL